MAVTSWIRRQFKNGVITTATSTMTAGATTFTVNTGAGSTFPDGSVGPFIVTVDQGQAAEEKILITSRSTDTFTVAASGRGYNGTTASSHTNAFVLHTMDQQDLDEANQVANQTLGAIVATGDLLVGNGANTLVKLARGTNGQFLQAGASTLSWGNAADKSSATTQAFTGAISATSYAGAVAATTVTASSTIVGSSTSQGTALIASGLTGATAASRYVGATASGSPGSGTFAQGDFIIDETGLVWICTVAGTPGTWVPLGGANQKAGTAGTAAAGSLSATLPLYTQSANVTGTPNGSGQIAVTFPTAFANGVSAVQVTAQATVALATPAVIIGSGTVTTSGFTAVCYTNYPLAGNLNTTLSTTFNWTARGN